MNKKLITSNNFRFAIFLVLTLLILLSTLPYFNILLSPQFIYFLFLIFFLTMFESAAETVSFIILIFIIFSLIVLLFFQGSSAEIVGNYIYFLLLTNFSVILLEYFKDLRNKK